MDELLINGDFQIEKMQGKGGWSFVLLPPVHQKNRTRFGWLSVKGTIDSYPIQQFKLWTTAKGDLFLPIKAAIRKKIKKAEGDWVVVNLYYDTSKVEIPEELLMCLMESPKAQAFFESIAESSQKHYIDWIYEAKSVETRANRIAKAIEKMERGLKVYQNLEE
jgi:hypothetical protein